MRKTSLSVCTGSAGSLVSARRRTESAHSWASYACRSVLFSFTRSSVWHCPLANIKSTFQLIVCDLCAVNLSLSALCKLLHATNRAFTVDVLVRRLLIPSVISVKHIPRFSACLTSFLLPHSRVTAHSHLQHQNLNRNNNKQCRRSVPCGGDVAQRAVPGVLAPARVLEQHVV